MARTVSRRSAEPEMASRSVSRRLTAMSEDRTTRTSREDRGSARRASGRGWAAASSAKKERSGFAETFKVEKKKEVIKFLEDGPYATYHEHWLRELPQGVKKSYPCIATDADGTGCPLCEELDDSPAFRAAFNVVDVSSGRTPKLTPWIVTPDPWDRIAEAHDDYGDLSVPDMYFAVSKAKQKNNRFTYKLERVKERDLDDDFPGVEPLTEDELEGFLEKVFTEDSIKFPTRDELEDVLEQLGD